MSSMYHKFANDIDVTANTYAGELALPYVTAAINNADTLKNGRARIIDGLTRKAVINNLGVTDPIQAAACSPTDGDNTSLNEQVLTLNDLQVYETICRGSIFPTWVGAQGKMNRNGQIPPTFANFLLATVAAKAAEHLETLMWQGAASQTPFATGFLSNTGTVDETGIDAGVLKDFVEYDSGDTAWSKANILDIFAGSYDAVAAANPALLSRPGFGFYVSYQTYGHYLQAIAEAGGSPGQGYMSQVTNQSFGQNVTYLGLPIYPTYGIPNDTDVLVATYPDNLVVGTNNMTADPTAQLIPVYQYDGSDNVRVAMKFAAGVQVALPTEGVIAFNFS